MATSTTNTKRPQATRTNNPRHQGRNRAAAQKHPDTPLLELLRPTPPTEEAGILGSRLRLLLQYTPLTAEMIGDRIGVDRSNIYQWQNGKFLKRGVDRLTPLIHSFAEAGVPPEESMVTLAEHSTEAKRILQISAAVGLRPEWWVLEPSAFLARTAAVLFGTGSAEEATPGDLKLVAVA